MELKCLLMWLLFGSVKGTGAGKCPPLPSDKYGNISAETFPLGTKLYYVCDNGYERRSSQYPGIRCRNISGTASWVYSEFECIEEEILLSKNRTAELNFTQKPARTTQSPAPRKQENIIDFCDEPKTIPHASLGKDNTYLVGQVIHFRCQTGYDKQPPISRTLTCKNWNGEVHWMPLDMQCTNGSSHRDKWLAHAIASAIFCILLIHSAVFV